MLYIYSGNDPINRFDPAGLADLVFVDRFNDRTTFNNARDHANDPNEIVIVAHGNPFQLVDTRMNLNVEIGANELAEMIVDLDRYTETIPIRILGCDAGNTDEGGTFTIAQRLADALAEKGGQNPVFGSSEQVYATSPEVYKNQFEWNRFEGRGSQ